MKYFRYHNTNYFFIKSKHDDFYLAIDAGCPCTLREYQRSLKGIGIGFKSIKSCIVTHLHMDHAGLLGEFLDSGIECYLIGHQGEENIESMERTIQKNCSDYRKIDTSKIRKISVDGINRQLKKDGFGGEVAITEGHSPDSISYITEEREAVVGDLAPIDQIMDDGKSEERWDLLKRKNVRKAYPSHAAAFELGALPPHRNYA